LRVRPPFVATFVAIFVATLSQTKYHLDKGCDEGASTKAAGLSRCAVPGNVQTSGGATGAAVRHKGSCLTAQRQVEDLIMSKGDLAPA
jgi:hypothetical protein